LHFISIVSSHIRHKPRIPIWHRPVRAVLIPGSAQPILWIVI